MIPLWSLVWAFMAPMTPALPQAPAADTDLAAGLSAARSLHGDAKRGKAMFQRNCVACHESHGFGDPFKSVPALAGQRYDYLVAQVARFASNDRRSTPMHWALAREHMREPQSWVDIAAYLSQLPAVRYPQGGGNHHVQLGGQIFRAHCAACHHADGRGGGYIPSLRGQHYSYLVDRIPKLGDAGHESFDQTQVAAIANYLSHLPGR